jgi:hypothetical protein
VRGARGEPRHAVDHVDHQIEAVDLVDDGELERGVDIALLLVAPHVQVVALRSRADCAQWLAMILGWPFPVPPLGDCRIQFPRPGIR